MSLQIDILVYKAVKHHTTAINGHKRPQKTILCRNKGPHGREMRQEIHQAMHGVLRVGNNYFLKNLDFSIL